MGGCLVKKEFNFIVDLLDFIEEQVEAANNGGLYLEACIIKQVGGALGHFELWVYFTV